MRVIEAAAAGLVVAVVTGVVAWRTDADVILVSAVAFLVGFAAWAGTGKTHARYGRRRRRH